MTARDALDAVNAAWKVGRLETKGNRMTRNRRSAKAAGTRMESLVASALAHHLDDDRIERRTRAGAKDRGDVGGVRIHDRRLVIEVKDCARLDLPGWTREAHAEAGNDDALAGVVVHKRRGTTDPLAQWVSMTLADLIALIGGHRPESVQ